MGQGAANAARLVSTHGVEGHHRAALREAIPLVDRQTKLAGMGDKIGGNLATADGDKAQTAQLLGQHRGTGTERQQQAQQLGHQHQTVG